MKLRKKREPKQIAKSRQISANRYYRPSPSRDYAGRSTLPNSENKSSRAKSLFSNGFLGRALNVVIIISLIGIFASASTLSSTVQVKSESGAFAYRTQEEYSNKASELLNQDFLRRSKLFFRSERYEREYLEVFPELSLASAILPLGGRELTLKIRSEEPLARLNSPDGSENLAITGTGVIAPLQSSSVSTSLPEIRFLDGLQSSSSGIRLLTTSEIKLLQLLFKEFSNFKITNAEITEISRVDFSVSRGEFILHAEGVNYTIKLSTYSDAREQIGALKAALDQLSREGITPLEYIDGRVIGRVYVK